MEIGHGFEIERVFEQIENSEVITIFFPRLGQALVCDLRYKKGDIPFIKVMPMVNTISSRAKVLRRARPSYPRIQEILSIPWVGYVETIKSSGLLKQLILRIKKTDSNQAVNSTKEAYKQLLYIQQQDLIQLLSGDRYDTVWTRQR